VQMVGIDDWSLRRSQSYGTILVDLQSHRPIELLADRTAAAVLPWLKAHPDIDVVSRDRASAYADAAHKALPDAIQVADRFHVLKNLREHLQRFLERKRASLPFVEDTPLNKEPGRKRRISHTHCDLFFSSTAGGCFPDHTAAVPAR